MKPSMHWLSIAPTLDIFDLSLKGASSDAEKEEMQKEEDIDAPCGDRGK